MDLEALEKNKRKRYIYKTEPWEHQKKALSYLYKRDAAALYTDMGTGKTKVMIDLIQSRGFRKVLVVAPNNACGVWEEQIKLHGLLEFHVIRLNQHSVDKVIEIIGQNENRQQIFGNKAIIVYIINYEKVWRKGLDKIWLRKSLKLDCVICDESHRIKTPRSKCSMYLARLGKVVPHRYLVTGTPLAENPVDVFAQYKFLDPSIFGTNFTNFRDEYENLDAVLTARIGYRILDKNNPYKNLDKLREKMFSCAFYIKSTVELPEQVDKIWKFPMPSKTETLYNQFFKEKAAELNGKWLETSNALTTILRLQQITSGYASVEDLDTKEQKIVNVDTARRDELRVILEDLQAEPVVVFARFKKDLKNIRKTCKEMGLSYSEVSGNINTLKEWKESQTQVLAVQYKSGSESIDLTRARYCIYYSLVPQLSLYEQSRKRIHRPGQTRGVVYIHMLETRRKGQTIDEKMYSALKSKKDVVNYVIEKGWE